MIYRCPLCPHEWPHDCYRCGGLIVQRYDEEPTCLNCALQPNVDHTWVEPTLEANEKSRRWR